VARSFLATEGWKNGRKVTDIYRTLTEGIQTTQMRAFPNLTPWERLALAHYVTIKDLMDATRVTRTALRQRLSRLMRDGLVERREVHQPRGRPIYVYLVAQQAERFFGSNYCDLAASLWQALNSVADDKTRKQIMTLTRENLVELYRNKVGEGTLEERVEGLRDLLAERGIDTEVELKGGTAHIRQYDCPYSALSEKGEGICALERQVFAELLNCPVTTRSRRTSKDKDYCDLQVTTPGGRKGKK
jgi:DeoR family suf operon transcriptional repressor